MTDADVLDIVSGALTVSATVAAPILVMTLVLGVAVSLIQTITQIQEQTLTFVPKLVAAGVILVVMGGWMIERMTSYIEALWTSIPQMV